ncbi:hypothetical protein FOA52_006194 [Chlamydomonas sp. UWO 241]|nr:hypothetical protein FOA52_006194 [Chlamydomonas sp. UWO 241]
MCTRPPLDAGGDCGGGSGTHGGGSFTIDISAMIDNDLPVWEQAGGAYASGFASKGLDGSFDAGDEYMLTRFRSGVHLGTHIDMPSHFLADEFKADNTVEKADLRQLMGLVLVVEVPRGSNITAQVLSDLNIPAGTERVIFKTDNTARRLMHARAFDTSYTGFATDGARYLVANTSVRTVGIDYISIARNSLADISISTPSSWETVYLVDSHEPSPLGMRDLVANTSVRRVGIDAILIVRYEDNTPTHVALLSAHVMVVEGLVLDAVSPGWYAMACLPPKLKAAEGAPARCVLSNVPDTGHEAHGEEYEGYGDDDAYYPDEECAGDGEWGWGYDPNDDNAAYEYWS